ncbi:MAG: Holliday junction DNA helicase RuvA [Ignavibacteria bacterium GWF2_33_9]|nr:MAG: Holliday junction DNA helicase RuvA [Ignavibacteria bacterium GWF2_33_9]
MIAYLTGKILEKKPTEVVVETNSVGFSIFMSMKTFEKLPPVGEIISLHTELIVREDSLTLYGFFTKSEKEMFILLTSVNGIGPKSAVTILSSIDSNELIEIISTSNSSLLQKFPGIGKKTAERIILELRDKVLKDSILELSIEGKIKTFNKNEAIEALVILGYNRVSSEKIISQILTQNSEMSTEDIIKIALSKLMK